MRSQGWKLTIQFVVLLAAGQAVASGPANTVTLGEQGVSAAPKALVRRSALDVAHEKLKELLAQ